jgi:hypothetical protein
LGRCWRYGQRFVDAFEVAKHQIECERLQLTVYLLGEGIGQKCEQTDRQ